MVLRQWDKHPNDPAYRGMELAEAVRASLTNLSLSSVAASVDQQLDDAYGRGWNDCISQQQRLGPIPASSPALATPQEPAPHEINRQDVIFAANAAERSGVEPKHVRVIQQAASAVGLETQWRQQNDWQQRRVDSLNKLYEDALIKLASLRAELASSPEQEPKAKECVVNPVQSRVCERGTTGCVVRHPGVSQAPEEKKK